MKPPPQHPDSCILIVDDEPANVALLRMILETAGYRQILSTTNSRRVLPMFREHQPDLILLDLMMPHLSGFDILEKLAVEIPPEDFVPVLVLTADVVADSRHRALAVGASDFVTKPFDQTEVLLRIRNLLRMRAQHLEIRRHNDTLETTVQARTRELRETLEQLKNSQQQMIQQERLSALGGMAAGLAHDFNNSLSLILGYGELLLHDLGKQPASKVTADHLNVIITAAQDSAKMFQRLRDFQRPAYPGQLVPGIDLNALVEQAIRLTKPRWSSQARAAGASIEVRHEAGNLSPLAGDPAGLRDVLTNLIFNAVDALPDGGTITVRTRATPGGTQLEISDTGVGMSEAIRRRCLEPFFTTKGDKGTGLGLAMVYGAINRHGGTVDIRSEPGAGTTFLIDLPASHETVPTIATIPGVTQPARILVVEDDAVYLELLAQTLAAGWHEIETASDGKTALAKMDAGEFDVVITDLIMPGMNGDQLAAQIRAASPRTRIILLTGFETSPKKTRKALETIDLVLSKPILNAALHEALAQVIAALPSAEPNSMSTEENGLGSDLDAIFQRAPRASDEASAFH